MSLLIDKGFTHKLAEEVLKDHPENSEAKKRLEKPKFRIRLGNQDLYFDSEIEMNNYLNGRL